ncbi:hypothetical protein EOPP23_04240 [Endozoicomonas sp. OPT23]|uniref:tetratricopeptide repeat protein n=1 Tax=Endozoicomonas sp. OPT23 TaxID=2072845 RepID=UPI00129C05D4|nr:tetratricopeptide repeat protein [Endozoicomonas sp. OPT23]MRI32206.1 hypothetical protein [Endozoicomonas sp. OPT23]
MKNLTGFSLLLAATLLSGCSTLDTAFNTKSPADAGKQSEASVTPAEPAEPMRSFDPDTLYDLMVAELGGQRKRYDLALGNYLKQAHKTQDKGVAKRAYQISHSIGAKQATLDAALLWARLDSENPAAIQAGAVELIRDGQLEEAVEQMKQVLQAGGEAHFDFLASSAIELSQEERDKLLTTFNVILKDYPHYQSLNLAKAILLLQSERYEEAMTLCNSLLSRDSGYVKGIILKGRLLNKVGRGDEAESMLANAVKKHPERPRLRLLYARILVHLEKLTEAREQFQLLLKSAPHDVEILLSLALIALENDMTGEAEQYFNNLLALGQRKSTAYYYLGRIAEKKGDFATARKNYQKVMPGKEFMGSRVALIQMLLKQGKTSDARKQLTEDRNRYPVHAVQLFLLESEILVGLEELGDAIKVLTDGVERNPKSTNLLYARAMVFEKVGQLGKLEKDLKAIIKVQPENAAALNALGYTLADRTKRYKEALVLIEQAYALDKEDPAIMDSMGWVNYRLGNLQKALKHLEQAYEKFPDPEVAAHLGEVLWGLGRVDDARVLFEEELKKKPDSKILLETQQRLEKKEKAKKSDLSIAK